MLQQFMRDVRGTFSIYLGVAILAMLMIVGTAVDVSHMTSHKSRLSDLADSTALAAAIVARDQTHNRRDIANEYFEENRELSGSIKVDNLPKIHFDDTKAEVTVAVSATAEYFLMGMFGFKDPKIKAVSTVGYLIDDVAPISIAFAFDRSGSMNDMAGIDTKIDALKQSTEDLFSELEAATERPDLLAQSMSTAFSSYNEALVDTSPMETGYGHVVDAVNAMDADGWTHMGPSLEYALNELDAEKASQPDVRWKGYVVFMTDGKNDFSDKTVIPAWDTDTLVQCNALKSSGYEVYAVAFAAPPEGEAILSQCASSAAHYFDSANSDDLRSAFKLIGRKIGSSTIIIKS